MLPIGQPIFYSSAQWPCTESHPTLFGFPLSLQFVPCTTSPSRTHNWLVPDALRKAGFPQQLVDYLDRGIDLGFISIPPAQITNNYSSVKDHLLTTVKEFERSVHLGRLEGPLTHVPHCVCPLGVVLKTKPDGSTKARLTFDATRGGVNPSLFRPSFPLPSIDQVCASLRRDDVMTVFDLQDGYFHVPVNPAEVDFLGCRHPATGEFYRYTYLPFGVATCPLLFCSFMNGISHILRRHITSGAVFVYIDDLLIISRSLRAASDFLSFFRSWSRAIGLRISWPKLEGPATTVKYIGYIINTHTLSLHIPTDKLTAIRKLLTSTLSKNEIDAATLLSLCGKLIHIAKVVRCGKMNLNAVWDITARSPEFRSYSWREVRSRTTTLSQDLRSTLLWWSSALSNAPCRRLWESTSGQLSLWDPSPFCFDAVDDSVAILFSDARADCFSASWGAEHNGTSRSGFFDTSVSHYSINALELLAVFKAILAYPSIKDCRVLCFVDNTAALMSLNKRSPRSKHLRDALSLIQDIEGSRNIEVVACFLPGALHDTADAASRNNFTGISLHIDPSFATIVPHDVHIVLASSRLHTDRTRRPLLVPSPLLTISPWRELGSASLWLPASCVVASYADGRKKSPRSDWALFA